jgi:hypothetical protein
MAVLLLALVGAAGAVLLLLIGAPSTTTSQEFVHSQGFIPWASLIAVQGAFWIVVAVPLWREVLDTYTAAKPSPAILAVPAILFLAYGVISVVSRSHVTAYPLAGHTAKLWILTGIAGIGVGIPAIFGICLVQDRVRRHTPSALDTSDIRLAVNSRAQTKRFLGLAGATIGLAVLAAGALQKALVPQFVPATQLPSSWVVLYGAQLTAILVIVYLPAHLSLRRLCADLRETWYPMADMPRPTADEFADWLDGRKQLDGLTQLDMTVSQHLQAAVFVLTPLLSGLLSSLIPRAG